MPELWDPIRRPQHVRVVLTVPLPHACSTAPGRDRKARSAARVVGCTSGVESITSQDRTRVIAKPCLVCGRRVNSGNSRCVDHENQRHRLPTPCRDCGRLSMDGWCADHRPPPFGSPRPETERVEAQPWRRAYRDPAYHRNRQAVITRARGRCERCGRADAPVEVDHIVPLSTAKGPGDIPRLNERTNLMLLCRFCHREKTAWERWRRRRR